MNKFAQDVRLAVAVKLAALSKVAEDAQIDLKNIDFSKAPAGNEGPPEGFNEFTKNIGEAYERMGYPGQDYEVHYVNSARPNAAYIEPDGSGKDEYAVGGSSQQWKELGVSPADQGLAFHEAVHSKPDVGGPILKDMITRPVKTPSARVMQDLLEETRANVGAAAYADRPSLRDLAANPAHAVLKTYAPQIMSMKNYYGRGLPAAMEQFKQEQQSTPTKPVAPAAAPPTPAAAPPTPTTTTHALRVDK